MQIKHHSDALKSAWRKLRETPLNSALTIAVIAIALTLPIGLRVVLKNLQTLTPVLDNSRQITLYLDTNITNDEAQDLANQIQSNSKITEVKYISPDKGLKELQQTAGVNSALDLLPDNPLPGVILVKPIANLTTTYQLTPLLNQLQAIPEVKNASLDATWLDRLEQLLSVIKYLEVTLFILFALAVLIIVGNTIRLNLQSAEREIEILRLVGASNSFIRRQFIYLGLLLGGIGSIGCWFMVSIIVHTLNFPIAKLAASYQSDFVLKSLTWSGILRLMLIGAILGVGGSLLSMHEHFKKTSPSAKSTGKSA